MIKGKLVFYSACMGMLLFGIVIITLGSVLPSIKEKFGLDEMAAGSLLSLLPFGILTGSVLFGPVVDRYGYKLILIIPTLLVFAGLEGISFAQNNLTLNISVFIIGFSGGILNGATNALVADISDEAKGANLSLLGVFYGIGALGMPTLLNILKDLLSMEKILSAVGCFILLILTLFLFVKFPAAKQAQGFPLKDGLRLFKSPVLLVAGFFLFFVSGSESLINNWTTTYLEKVLSVNSGRALTALSVLVASLTLSRLLLGKILKHVSSKIIFFGSIALELAASIIIWLSSGYYPFISAIILMGMGMAAGFPIMLGYVADIFSGLSGTAFSVVFVLALTGNMIINYSMGIIAQTRGIDFLPIALMICFSTMLLLLLSFLSLAKGKIKT